jgi:hypothetical protein
MLKCTDDSKYVHVGSEYGWYGLPSRNLGVVVELTLQVKVRNRA